MKRIASLITPVSWILLVIAVGISAGCSNTIAGVGRDLQYIGASLTPAEQHDRLSANY